MARSQGDRTAREGVVATNRRARHDYEILETYEAGLVLRGTEVKSLRERKANLKDSYGRVEGNEIWLVGCHISPYHHGTDANHVPDRKRKLLLSRKEINRLLGKTMERGLTLIPLRLYFTDRGRAKLELGLARGKKLHDKRRTIREREARREIDKALRGRLRGVS
ncbi:MAG: SsrA-binding protein SmpB [Candidatus Methylomirabilia bacterium]